MLKTEYRTLIINKIKDKFSGEVGCYFLDQELTLKVNKDNLLYLCNFFKIR